MYAVMYFDEACYDDITVFHGTLADCRDWIADSIANYDDDDDDYFIVAPDGFTVVG